MWTKRKISGGKEGVFKVTKMFLGMNSGVVTKHQTPRSLREEELTPVGTLEKVRRNLSKAILQLDEISKKAHSARKHTIHRKIRYLANKRILHRHSFAILEGMKLHPERSKKKLDNAIISNSGSDKMSTSPFSENFNYISSHSALDKIADISPPFECKDNSSPHSSSTESHIFNKKSSDIILDFSSKA